MLIPNRQIQEQSEIIQEDPVGFPDYNKFNSNAKYSFDYKSNPIEKSVFFNQEIMLTPSQIFNYYIFVIFQDIESPKVFSTFDQVKEYIKNSTMNNWENQFKFAIYCATSRCGVSWYDHINHSDSLVRSIFRFHVYFTIRKLLHQLKMPLPGNPDFNSNKNPYDIIAYEKLKL
jgi:hypothetical protein